MSANWRDQTLAIDFSNARPNPVTLKAAGVVAVGRYLTGGGGKAITPAESQSYTAQGIVQWFVMENTATDAEGGHGAGLLAASASAYALATLIGPPAAGQPRYFAADENIDPAAKDAASMARFQAAVAYFVGISRVIDPAVIGAYGNGAFLDFLGACGLASWFWQSSSTSFAGNAQTIPAAHLRQVTGGGPLPQTDLDIIRAADFGQYPRPA